MKIASIVGARPQFVKAAALSPALRRLSDEVIIHTGQHYDKEMSDVFFDALAIPEPDHNLGIGSATHGKQTGLMLAAIEETLIGEKPDFVIVYGDTNSTLAGSLAAAKLQLPVGHVEAGLRSYIREIPEEINRLVTDHLSTLLFAPTKHSVENLRREGITKGVHLVGDVMYDLTVKMLKAAEAVDVVSKYNLKSKGFVLATVHRSFNTDNERILRDILGAFQDCGRPVLFPVHPRTAKAIRKFGITVRGDGRLIMIKPVDYLEFLGLLRKAEKVVTDSGGVQKEAYFSGIPCITLRKETEWPETVETGWNLLAGTDKSAIVHAIKTFEPKDSPTLGFGDGHAAEKITRLIVEEVQHRD